MTSRGSCTRSGASATCSATDGGRECHCAADLPLRVPQRSRSRFFWPRSSSTWSSAPSCSDRSTSELQAQAAGLRLPAALVHSQRPPSPARDGRRRRPDLAGLDRQRQRGLQRRQRARLLPFDRSRPVDTPAGSGGSGPYLRERRPSAEPILRELTVTASVGNRFGCGAGRLAAGAAARPRPQRPRGPPPGPVPAVRGRDSTGRVPRAVGGRARARAARRGRPDRAAHHRHRGPDQPDPVPRRRRGRPARRPASTR